MSKINVFYTGAFRFPDLDAAGKRVAQMVRLIEATAECNNIIVGGWEQGDIEERKYSDKCSAFSFSLLDKTSASYIYKMFSQLLMGMSVIKWMISNRNRYAVVILYNPPFIFALLALMFSSIFGKKIALDSTEWYESDFLPGGRYGFAAIENWCRMRVAYPLFNNHIVISSFLQNHFKRFSKNLIKVPPVANEFVAKTNTCSREEIKLFYAGLIGQKDKLEPFIRRLALASKNSTKVKFYIAGVSEEQFFIQFKQLLPIRAEISNVCVFLGRIPMNEVYSWYGHINYCVFFRDNKRYALAGFPSKFVESLSFDTPVITNAVGDVASYFPDVGFLFDPEKDDVDQLIELLAESEENKKIEHVFTENFSVKSQQQKMLTFMDRLK